MSVVLILLNASVGRVISGDSGESSAADPVPPPPDVIATDTELGRVRPDAADGVVTMEG